jgi:hypothetical protein
MSATEVVRAVENPYLDEFLKVMQPAPVGERRFESWVARPEYDILNYPAPRREGYKSAFTRRSGLVQRFAWAVPDLQALRAIAELERPVVEIGAGTGCWAHLLAALGVSITAFDEAPGHNHYCDHAPYTQVYPGDHRVLEHVTRWSHGDSHALLLCWPPMLSMASECVEAFKGDTLIYVGEGCGGCTADDRFFELVTGESRGGYDEDGEWIEGADVVTGWEETASVAIPQWSGIRDYLTVWRR